MRDEDILLLSYYYRQKDRDHPILKPIIGHFCPAYLPFDLYLYEPLKENFGRVLLYDFLQRRAALGLKAMNDEVLALVKDERPKYVLWTSFQDDIRHTTLEAIRRVGSTVIGWFFDDEWRFHSYSKYWIPYLDYCVTNSMSAVPSYRRLGARVIQTIPNTGVAVDVDWSRLEEKHDLTFVGSVKLANRQWYLRKFGVNKIPVKLLGEESGGYVPFQQMLDIFRTSRINLNFSRHAGRGPRQIKGRVFQVCLAGGFLLTEYAPGIEMYFRLGEEIVCFDSPQEMVDKTRYYLNHELERRHIARAGWERAKGNYSSSRMVARVFEEIEEDMASGTRINGPPARLWKTMQARRVRSTYHMAWARVQIEEDDTRGLWKDDLELALSYNPGYALARFYRFVANLPLSIRLTVFRTVCRTENKRFGFTAAVCFTLWLVLMSFVRHVTQILLRRLQSGHRA